MKNLLFLLLGSTLLVAPSLAQTDKDISLPEFRQSLYDFATIVDARQGTNFATQFQNISDDTLATWYKGIPNGRRFQQAVGVLKAKMGTRSVPATTAPYASAAMAAVPRDATATAEPKRPMFSPLTGIGAAGISSVTAPSFALFSPNYPDTVNGVVQSGSATHWESMITTLQGISALPSGNPANDFNQRCDPDVKTVLEVLAASLEAAHDAADAACEIVPDILVCVLGEGATVPAKEICFAITLILNVFNSAAEGLADDCDEQDALVQSAEIEAMYNNTLALYNLKLRLQIEQNLLSTSSPMGLFELPSSLGGFLEIARAIAYDAYNKMTASGANENSSAAAAALTTGDNDYAAKNYKAAYKSYQTAYGYIAK
jgi:hypothetical protein